MATSEYNKLLLSLIDSIRSMPLASPGPGTQLNVADAILRNSRQNWQPKTVDVEGGGPSNISRVFDILRRPGQAVLEPLRRAVEHPGETSVGDLIRGIGSGIMGDVDPNTPGAQKTWGSDVLSAAGITSKPVLGVAGFGLDIATDPTSYIGPGVLRRGGEGILKLFGKEVGPKVLPKAPPTLTLAKSIKPKAETILEPQMLTEPAESLLDQVASGAMPVHVLAPKIKVEGAATFDKELGRKVGAEYYRKLKIPTDRAITPRQQTLIYSNILRKVGGDHKRAAGIYTEAEDFISGQGARFKLWDDSHGSLSDVIAELGSNKITPDILKEYGSGKVTHPGLMQIAEIMKARSAMADEPKIQGFMREISQAMAVADDAMSPAAAKNVKTSIRLHQPEMVLSPVGVQTANQFIKDLEKSTEGYVQLALDKQVRTIHATVAGDTRKLSDVTDKMRKAREEAMGIHYKDLGDKNAFDTLAMTFSTWYKNPDLRMLGHTSTLLARSSAARRLHELRQALKKPGPSGVSYTKPEIAAAWREAQGYVSPTTPLAKYFRDEMERLFSSSGIRDEADSVALRSQLAMQDINTELKRLSSPHKYPQLKNIRFVQDFVTDPVTGKIRDYSGVNWLKSWETWDVKNPEEMLFGLQTAVETVMKHYGLLDETAARFGSKVPHGDFTHKIEGIPRLRGYYFPQEIAEQVPVMLKNLKDMYQAKSPIVRSFDHALSAWKRGVTIYAPSHHIRNLSGDVFFNWMAGVKDPRVYTQSAQILRAMRHRYEGAHIDELVGRGAATKATGGKVIFRKWGHDITDEMLYVNGHNQGLFLSARDIEDVLGDKLTFWQPFGGNVNQAASKVAEVREHYVILAHYIDAVRRSKAPTMEKAFEEAGAAVRKWHPNGTDLTATERNLFRRLIPFYSWNRKAIPLLIESIMFNPAKVEVIPKSVHSLQTLLGITPAEDDPFPVDQAFPSWLREQGIGPIGLSGAGGITGFLGNLGRTETQNVTGEPLDAYTVLGTRLNPLTDIASQFEPNPVKGVMESVNPAIQLLFELGKGQTLSGRSISSDPLRYTAEQLPVIEPFYRIFNRPGSERGKDETPLRPLGTGGPEINIEALLNHLFATGIVGTGPYIPQRRR